MDCHNLGHPTAYLSTYKSWIEKSHSSWLCYQRFLGISWLVGWLYWSCFTNSNSSIRFWNEPRCARKYAGIEKYHPKFCLDDHDFSPRPPPPPPPANAGDLAQGGFGDQAIALAVTPEKKKTQLNVDADEINDRFTIGYYSIISKLSFLWSN